MSDPVLWCVVTGVAVAVELLTGTFYLLMLAIGLAAGALAAYLGAPTAVQLVAAAVVGGGFVAGWHFKRMNAPAPVRAGANHDVNLDVGASVHVDAWSADDTASVRYRGATWTAIAAPGSAPTPGNHRVIEVSGSRLVVEKV